jgi:PTS system nitrogen regulatory IIA component
MPDELARRHVCISTGAAMEIKDFLSPTDTIVDVRASDKAGLLQELSRQAAASLNLRADLISGDILKREDLGSTGMGNGVAIPHARIPNLKKPFGILARLRKPIDFDAIDSQPVDLVFFLLLPVASGSDQLNALACVSRKFRDAETVRCLRRATDGAELYRAMMLEIQKRKQ